MLTRIAVTLGIFLTFACVNLDAWSAPVGTKFQVNTTGSGYSPSVAQLNGGGFIVVWEAAGSFGWDIYGQRFRANGTPVGPQFRVNRYKQKNQKSPSVAAFEDGGFVVVWQSNGQDGSDYGIYGQRFAANGRRAGDEFRVNTKTTGPQRFPRVASLDANRFVVVWQSRDSNREGIFGQRYSAEGTEIGEQFRINTTTANSQEVPLVAGRNDGKFTVIWESGRQPDPNGKADITGQRFGSGGRLGTEFRINPRKEWSSLRASIATLGNGGFVVVWQSSFGVDAVFGRLYSALGTPIGGVFQITPPSAESAYYVYVAALGDGGFVVVWSEHSFDAEPEYEMDFIKGQRYSAPGKKVGGDFEVDSLNSYYDGSLGDPIASPLPGGGFVVIWWSGGDILAQRYSP